MILLLLLLLLFVVAFCFCFLCLLVLFIIFFVQYGSVTVFVLFCFVRLFFLLIHSISFFNNDLQDFKVKNIGTERMVEFCFKNVYLSG